MHNRRPWRVLHIMKRPEKPRYPLKDILLGWVQVTVICLIVLAVFITGVWLVKILIV